ncbi:KPNB1 [Symbiodinium natans]|uniref:KPNB1 protein n=1 Tax=Symbiodinium natans TaxID=878477 RepID=A0A812SNH2_9DINO|nr:KPNB1 [Symbiodinium natans]
MADLNVLLLQWLSPNGQARQAAEQKLLEIRQMNPASFAASCAATMCDVGQLPQARQLAALLLKNTLPVPGQEVSLPGPVLQALADPDDAALRRGAALCAAKLACSGWPSIGPQLLALCRPPGATPELVSCFGQIAELWQSSGAGVQPDGAAELAKAVAAVVSFLSPMHPVSLRDAAAEALCSLVPMLGAAKDSVGQVLAAVLVAGTGEAELRLLGVCACECYEALQAPDLQRMVELCHGALHADGEASRVQAIELWETLAAYELYLLDGKPSGQCRGLVQQALPTLMPLLLQALQARAPSYQKSSWDPDDDASPVQEAACGAVMTVAKVTGDACVGLTLPFASAAMASQDEWQRRSALLAFGALQDGPSAQALRPLVASALPRLMEGLRSQSLPEASAAAWTLGRVLDKNPGSVPDEAQVALFETSLQRLRTEAGLAEELCYCLDGLVDQQAAVLEPAPFGVVLEALLAGARAARPESRTQHALLSCLTELLGRASEDCLPQMELLLDDLLRQADGPIDIGVPGNMLHLATESEKCCLCVSWINRSDGSTAKWPFFPGRQRFILQACFAACECSLFAWVHERRGGQHSNDQPHAEAEVQGRAAAVAALLARHGAAGEEECSQCSQYS